MEVLHILEEKIARLIASKKQDLAMIAQLKQESADLQKTCENLKVEVEKLEDSLLLQDKTKATIDEERKEAQMAVDELINSIDAFIEDGLQE
jgi:predicted chitinase